MATHARPSFAPAVLALAGCALVLAGGFLPWVYLYGHRAQNGFRGGWIVAHLRSHFSDGSDPYPVAWQFGADVWIVLAIALLAFAVALRNRSVRDQRYDRIQFALGAAIVAVVAYNALFILAHADDHFVHSDPGGDAVDRLGAGMLVTMLGGLTTALGALVGNTPEFDFPNEPIIEAPP